VSLHLPWAIFGAALRSGILAATLIAGVMAMGGGYGPEGLAEFPLHRVFRPAGSDDVQVMFAQETGVVTEKQLRRISWRPTLDTRTQECGLIASRVSMSARSGPGYAIGDYDNDGPGPGYFSWEARRKLPGIFRHLGNWKLRKCDGKGRSGTRAKRPESGNRDDVCRM